jgi:thiamine biosynthesis lipoprotein
MLSPFNKIASFFLLFIVLFACEAERKSIMVDLNGKTMGTTYHISYRDSLGRNLQLSIDSLLLVFNQEVSTYIPDSRISQFNKSDSGIFILAGEANYFAHNLKLSGLVYGHSGGWFNPCVMPLVRYFNFGPDKKALAKIDSALVDSLQKLVNFDAVSVAETPEGTLVRKNIPRLEVDFSAIAKGDACDQIGLLLESRGLRNYMIEIGGEVRARGFQSEEFGWMVGINTPTETASTKDMQVIVELRDLSLATSGNYRNFHEVNGVKYAHTINPFTGYPEGNTLLSVSIFAKDCGFADALATASMAMGLKNAEEMVRRIEGVDAYFIFSDADGQMQMTATDGLKNIIKE